MLGDMFFPIELLTFPPAYLEEHNNIVSGYSAGGGFAADAGSKEAVPWWTTCLCS